ncbi:acyl dehydratase [Nocardioides albertanoniae]|uniref:Acyl dehydratase n=1 Tax=Nocardioides albertanoniae TaxID=1175486 RepID=A0A543A7V9_9ACTN|nr:MaoC/PaaZ C-terminal domain-containing protein [Nocardioides albertanoniae]TQL68692.1 acyl dehydratase [Nocardioides albertanoniae]
MGATETLWLEDLEPGRNWRGPSRTVTEADVVAFAGLTGDQFPLHTSEEYARGTPYGTRIAHGLLGLAYAHGLMWARTGEMDHSVIAFLGIKEWSFTAPIHFGDTIHVDYQVASNRRSTSQPDRGVVDFDVAVLNQRDEIVQGGIKTLMVAARPVEFAPPTRSEKRP